VDQPPSAPGTALAGAFLYVPGDRPDLVGSARRRAAADAVILDLEDAVAPDRKAAALAVVTQALRDGGFGSRPWVRLSSPLAADEARVLAATGGLGGVWLPKAERLDQVDAVARALPDDVVVGVLVESALGVLDARGLAAHPRVGLLQIGEIDLAASLGVDGSVPDVLDPHRAWVVAASSAAGLPAPIGPVWAAIDDLDGFASSTTRLVAQGFGGRACLHPGQLVTASAAFRPSADAVAAAERLLEQHERNLADGVGVHRGDDGGMVDEAVVRRARAVLRTSSRAHGGPVG
jgi:citrate lyase beta subunit